MNIFESIHNTVGQISAWVVQFEPSELAQIQAQTGNPLIDIISGNMPLGNLFINSAWSLLNLMMAVLALVFSVLLIIQGFLACKKEIDDQQANVNNVNTASKEGKEQEQKRHHSLLVKVGVVALGILVLVAFNVMDDITLPMVWINQWTPIVAVFFLLHAVLLVLYCVISNKTTQTNKEDYKNHNKVVVLHSNSQ